MVWRLSEIDPAADLRVELDAAATGHPPHDMDTTANNATFGGNVSAANCSYATASSYPRSCSAPADNQCPLPGQSPASTVAMFTVGVLGNIIALIVLFLSRKNHKRTVFYLLVTGLAWTDLLGKIVTTPMVWAVYINNMEWLGGCYTCNYHGWSMLAAGLSSCLIVFVMAVERFIAIRHPYFYNVGVTRMKAKITLVVCWLVAILIAALPLMGLGENVMHFPGTWCFFNFYGKETTSVVYASLFVAVLGVCILGTLFCNLSVIATLLRMRNSILRTSSVSQSDDLHKSVHAVRNEEDSPRRRRRTNVRAETQMVVLLAGVSIIFTVSWSPLMIRVLLNQLPNYQSEIYWDLVSVRMASMNQILDPWIYILFRRELFIRVIKIVKDLTCKIRQVPNKQAKGGDNKRESGMVTFSNGHANRASRAVADAIFHHAIDENDHLNSRETGNAINGERRPSGRSSLGKRRPSWRDCLPALSPNDDRYIYSSMEDGVFEEPTTKFETITPEASPLSKRQTRTMSDGAVSNLSPNTLKRRASGTMEKSYTFHGIIEQ
ncbi:PREDICTED: prostaglandin E2 receptor EP4 subtype-like [Branchiostoma belcheri]|uniref:Thromboxane A2 receptor n=1 Tax=Branchiostoma belcheri TaxID=7741 RepID=A0A6P4ZP80_BRABE|nr:PREDICTED: prostaglandin E2 receptor EP4 subtype-like [Branchiostoma belcheri]XP_019631472.1 PREDICTED: prostaglandin E2 receptor EP4 subtype-like [Branchiostoma belcheri]